MTTYEFCIIASGLDPAADGFADRFFEAGCDDATVSFQKGCIIVDFSRDAPSIDVAISTAIENVASAGARVERVEPDPLVSLSDIAARTGLSRAAITNYAKGDRAEHFPVPVARVTAKTSLYDWATVAVWLFQHDHLSRNLALEAEAVRVANEVIRLRTPKLREQLQSSIKAYAKLLDRAA